MAVNKSFGIFFKQIRMSTRFTLRDFCIAYDLDPIVLSRLERGITPPSDNDEEIGRYAVCLDLEEGGDLWNEFFNQAALCRGPIADEISEAERTIRECPCFFQCDLGEDLSGDETVAFMETIRKEIHREPLSP